MKPLKFSIDGDPAVPAITGYDSGTRWNGWCEPLVTEAAVREYVAALKDRRERLYFEATPGSVSIVWAHIDAPGEWDVDGAWTARRTDRVAPTGEPLYSFAGEGICWAIVEAE
jgi:hypothetical protein